MCMYQQPVEQLLCVCIWKLNVREKNAGNSWIEDLELNFTAFLLKCYIVSMVGYTTICENLFFHLCQLEILWWCSVGNKKKLAAPASCVVSKFIIRGSLFSGGRPSKMMHDYFEVHVCLTFFQGPSLYQTQVAVHLKELNYHSHLSRVSP